MRAMTFPRDSWVLLSICTSLLLTAAARPLSAGDVGSMGDGSVNTLAVQDADSLPVAEKLIAGLGLQSEAFLLVKKIAVGLGFSVGKGSEGAEHAGKAVEVSRFRPIGLEEEFLAQARGASPRNLLQTGGSQQQQPGNAYPGYYQGGLLVSPFLSIVMGAAICVGLCVFLSVCRVVVRHRFAQPLTFEATARQEAPSAALPNSILKGLPIVSFKKEGENQTFNQGNGENQCPICLIEFEPKDSLRKLPECSHYFHQGCVDEWFKRNHTCPLCRTSLLPSEPSSADASPADGTSPHAQIEVAAPSGGEAVVPVAALEQEAGQAGPCPAPLEREGPGARL